MALTQVNSEGIKDGEIKDADVNASAAIAGSKLAAATTSAAGLMSAADKTKLDGVATSATANPSAPALTGSTDNTICTVTGANAIQGEATLTYDGTDELEIKPATAIAAALTFDSNRTGAGNHIGRVNAKWNGTDVAKIVFACGDDTTNKDEGVITFRTAAGGGAAVTDKLTIEKDGNVNIHDGNLVVANTHGIDFSASEGSGVTTNGSILDDYEEGAWTPVYSSTGISVSGYNNQVGRYIKVGRAVYIEGILQTSGVSLPSGNENMVWDITGLPFTSDTAATSGYIACHLQSSWSKAPHALNVQNNSNFLRARRGISLGDGGYTSTRADDFHTGSGNRNRIYFNGWYRTT